MTTTRGAEPAPDHIADTGNMVPATTRADTLRSLADRVEAGDRDLSPDIWAAAGWEVRRHARWGYAIREVGESYWQSMPRLTSLDAVSAFTEAVLPGWTFVVQSGDSSDGEGRWHECVMENWTACADRTAEPPRVKGFGFIPETNARLAAALRALAMEADRALTGDRT